MRKTFSLAAVLLAAVAVADDAAVRPAGSGGESATAGGAAQPQSAEPARPLHRHPVLFGMLQRNNSIRRRVGLFPHRMNPALTQAAQDHANYMARTGQFSHYVNGGHQYRAQKYGFRGGVRENIAMSGGPDTAFGMWQASGAHYASIVSGTTEAGFGYAVSPSGMTYFVGIYGTPPAGDPVGETEEEIAAVLEEEKAEQLLADNAAEKTAAGKDPSVKPASATTDTEQKPAGTVQPAAASEPVKK